MYPIPSGMYNGNKMGNIKYKPAFHYVVFIVSLQSKQQNLRIPTKKIIIIINKKNMTR